MKRVIVLFALLGLFSVLLNAQDSKSRKEKKQEKKEKEFAAIASLIESKVYMFIARKANPSGGQQVDLTTHTADLIIHNDSVESYLPFYGRAYNIAYGGSDSGITFETLLIDYKVEKNSDKHEINISFSAKSDYDKYDCNLSVSSSGSATLSVTCVNRAFISYYGTIVPKKQK